MKAFISEERKYTLYRSCYTVDNFLINITEFIKKSYNITQPLSDKMLLLDNDEITTMIDDLIYFYDDLYNKNKEGTKFIILKLFTIIMLWHQTIRIRYEKLEDECFCYSYMFSWINICRLMSIKIQYYDNYERLLNNPISEIPFIQLISKVEQVIISDDNIKDLNMLLLWQNILILYKCLDTYPYSKLLDQYFYTIFLFYTKFILYKDNMFTVNDYPKYYTKKETISKDIKTSLIDEYSQQISYNELDLTLDDGNNIKSGFIFDTEIIFNTQIIRLSIMKKLDEYDNKFHYHYKNNDNLNKIFFENMVDIFNKSILNIITQTFLKTNIANKFNQEGASIHLRHGEKTKYYRNNVITIKPHPNDILHKLRPNDSSKLNSSKKSKIPGDYINEYTQSIKTFFLKNKPNENTLFKLYHNYTFLSERESIYLTYISLQSIFNISLIHNMDIENFFICEYFNDLSKFEDIIQLIYNKQSIKIPILLNIMRHSYVIDSKTNQIYHTIFFIEAYIIWMVLMIKYGHISNTQEISFTDLYKPFTLNMIIDNKSF